MHAGAIACNLHLPNNIFFDHCGLSKGLLLCSDACEHPLGFLRAPRVSSYLHCSGCEDLLGRDFNLCPPCFQATLAADALRRSRSSASHPELGASSAAAAAGAPAPSSATASAPGSAVRPSGRSKPRGGLSKPAAQDAFSAQADSSAPATSGAAPLGPALASTQLSTQRKHGVPADETRRWGSVLLRESTRHGTSTGCCFYATTTDAAAAAAAAAAVAAAAEAGLAAGHSAGVGGFVGIGSSSGGGSGGPHRNCARCGQCDHCACRCHLDFELRCRFQPLAHTRAALASAGAFL